jgi:hypothetical protein
MLGNFRELTATEVDFVYGGYGGEIVVTGMRPRPSSGGIGGGSGGGTGNGWGHGSDTDGNWQPDPENPGNIVYGCDTDDGAAMRIADGIKSTQTNASGPGIIDWRSAEYASSIVRGSDGRFYTGSTDVYTDGNLGSVTNRSTTLSAGESYAGFIHNHPDFAGDDMADLSNRYPSAGDYQVLAAEAAKFGVSNPSIWIIDKFGDVREFKLLDRNNILRLTEDQRVAGMGLPSKISQSAC